MNKVREIAGLSCIDMLENLSAYVDGELDAETVARVKQHLAGCDNCERFEGRFAAMVQGLRDMQLQSPELPADFSARLNSAIKDASD